ncbi:ribosome-recycling factor [Impatiens glandulifera]|uniref:ribosome-recycling factor n=1 Tax=Impatiens glandulifera TaxID=253017 RepID=UPI001FB163F0|nr:ribosome-recycling factor [Impatiens glandulifera]
MATSIRRAFISCRSRHLLHFLATPDVYSRKTMLVPCSPAVDSTREIRRNYAKGRKSRADDDEDVVVNVNIQPSLKAAAVSQMEAATESLSRELSKLRTGRASAGMLDHIIVETSGVKMPLSRMALVSVLDPKTLSISPYDPNSLKELEKAIASSPLGLNPRTDGERLIAAIPPLTKDHMQALAKVVSKSSEDVKQSIRRARQKAIDSLKKAGSSISKDDVRRFEKEIDELTKKFIKSVEDMCKAKEKDISQS